VKITPIHTDGGLLLVPPLGVSIASGAGQREEHFLERAVVAFGLQKLGGFQEHQYETPAGAFSPFALDEQHAGEKLPGEYPIILHEDRGVGGVRVFVTPV